MPDTVGSVLERLFKQKNWSSADYTPISRRAGLADQHIKRIIAGENENPSCATLLKIADAMRLNPQQRAKLEAASGYVGSEGFLKETKAEDCQQEKISMRRAVLLLTAFHDPVTVVQKAVESQETRERFGSVAARWGVVFGEHDVVTRITTARDISVLDFSQMLFSGGELRTIETVLLRDDLPIYVDKTFSNEHLTKHDYDVWATIFVQGLGGDPDVEFPKVFHDVQKNDFHGGVHLLTAAVTVGQYDSMIEIIAANVDLLQKYVRACQDSAMNEGRQAHTVTYFSMGLEPRPFVAEF